MNSIETMCEGYNKYGKILFYSRMMAGICLALDIESPNFHSVYLYVFCKVF